jgi:hypothetical protein
MTRPPFDLDFKALDIRRLRRLAKRMGILELLESWREQWVRYQDDPDVQSNSASSLGL